MRWGPPRDADNVYTPQSGQRWPGQAGGIDGLLATGPGVAGLGQRRVISGFRYCVAALHVRYWPPSNVLRTDRRSAIQSWAALLSAPPGF